MIKALLLHLLIHMPTLKIHITSGETIHGLENGKVGTGIGASLDTTIILG
jgi:hypothetical protein